MKHITQKITVILTTATILSSMVTLPVSAATDDDIQVFLNGQKISFDVPPMIMNDFTMVPMRAIFEALGYKVVWDDANKSITAINDENTIFMKLLSNEMTYNDTTITLAIPPVNINGRTLVPVRAISETSGYNVSWDTTNRTVIIGDITTAACYDATKEIEQINSFIEQGLYLEAIECCEQTLAWHELSFEDISLLRNLYKLSEEKYNEYLQSRKIKLGYGAPEQYASEYYITPEQVIDIIYKKYGVTVSHTMTGTTLFWFEGEGLRFTVERWYCEPEIDIDDLNIEDYVTMYNAVNEVQKIQSYINQGLYLEAINLCDYTMENHILSFSDRDLLYELKKESQEKYDLYIAKQKEINLSKTVSERQKRVIYDTIRAYVSSVLKSSATAIWPNYTEFDYKYTSDGQIISTGIMEAMNSFGGYGKVYCTFLFNDDLSVDFWYVN